MVCIKLKTFTLILTVSITITLVATVLVQGVKADEQRAHLIIRGEPSYKLTKEISKGKETLGRTYQIDLEIENIGNIRSEETIINLSDEEGFILKDTAVFEPGETKKISFTWSTLYNFNQELKINYFPKNLDIVKNSYNSGSTSLIISPLGDEGIGATDTPGFEIIIFILSLILFIIYRKKMENN